MFLNCFLLNLFMLSDVNKNAIIQGTNSLILVVRMFIRKPETFYIKDLHLSTALYILARSLTGHTKWS